MKKLFIPSLILFFITQINNSSHAQSWDVINPNPEPAIIRVSIPDSMHIRGLGWNTFYYSDNGGISWFKNTLPNSNVGYTCIDFINANEGWLASIAGLYHTVNGGQTFNLVPLPVNRPVSDVNFQNQLQGLVLVPGVNIDSVFITDNGGSSWTGVSIGATTSHIYYTHIYFISPTTGWMLKGNTLFKTIDGGYTWNPQLLPASVSAYVSQNPVSFIDSLHGWVSGFDTLMYTDNGGNTWNYLSTLDNGSIAFKDSLNGVYVFSSQVAVTHDGGHSWNILNIIDHSMFMYNMGATVVDSIFYIYGGGYVISSNDGDTWKKLATNSFPYSLSASSSYMSTKLSFSSRGKGVFITGSSSGGMSGPINDTYITNDSGYTWKEAQLWDYCTDIQTLNDSLWYTSEINYFVGESRVYKSSNNFDTPGQLIGNFADMINCIYFIDSLHGVIGGDSIKYTTDGGLNWFDAFYSVPGSDYVSGISFVDNLNGWAFGFQFVARTIDGGIHWNTIFTNTVLYSEICQIGFVDTLNGFMLMTTANDTTFMYQTSDGGISWSPVYLPYACWEFHFSDSLHGWLATNYGMYYTDDGLTTLYLQDSHNTENISFYDHAHGYAASSELLIHSDQTSVLNTISEKINTVGIHLYPNPAKDYFTVSSDRQLANCSISIFNVTGKIIFERNAGTLSPQSPIRIPFRFSAGMYFVKIGNGNYECIRKLVVE